MVQKRSMKPKAIVDDARVEPGRRAADRLGASPRWFAIRQRSRAKRLEDDQDNEQEDTAAGEKDTQMHRRKEFKTNSQERNRGRGQDWASRS